MCPSCESENIEYDRYTGGYSCQDCDWTEETEDDPCLTDHERNQ